MGYLCSEYVGFVLRKSLRKTWWGVPLREKGRRNLSEVWMNERQRVILEVPCIESEFYKRAIFFTSTLAFS